MATTDELGSYYAGLLIIQYKAKAKAAAMLKGFAQVLLADQLVLAIKIAYSVDNAVGPQLDVIGKYAGVSRLVRTFTTQVELNDDDYRILIKIKIALNYGGASLKDVDDVLHAGLADILRVYDYENMHISYSLDADAGSLDLAQAMVREGFLPRPMGVQIGSLTYLPSGTKLFGFRRSNRPKGLRTVGFDTAANDVPREGHWLNSGDVIAP